VFVPQELKETMFFDVEERFKSLGMDGYLEFFKEATDEVAIGEVTPGYLWSSGEYSEWGPPGEFRRRNPERVLEKLGPEVKLVAVLRNPVDRALSAFLHHRRMGRIPETETIGPWLHRHAIAHIGFYGAHLARWAEVFPHRNFCVLTYDEMFANQEARRGILEFLGATPSDGGKLVSRRFNKGGFTRNGSYALDSIGRVIATESDVTMLRELYWEDVKRLEAEWDLDMQPWEADFHR
jgi:hypothetical protein